jgi:chain length determinant protein tyrosine kinase EpsG
MNTFAPTAIPLRAQQTLGRILLEQGKLDAQAAEQVLRLQKEKNLRFGEAAVQLGLISEADMRQALARQFDYPYLAPGQSDYSPELVAAYDPYGAPVEALRALRSQLMLRWFATHKTLAVLGVDDGKTASQLTANLAVVFSQLGERTLLIDANLRASQVSGLFNLGNRPGLADLLADRAGLAAIVRIPEFVDLSVLPAGAQAPNPAELIARPQMIRLLENLADHYDVTLLDAPPTSQSADYQIVAARVRGALLVVSKNRTRLADVAAAKTMLAAAGAEPVGAVLN